MKVLCKRGDESTIRILVSDDKSIVYGCIGTVSDLLSAGLFDTCSASSSAWAFIFHDCPRAEFFDSRSLAISYVRNCVL